MKIENWERMLKFLKGEKVIFDYEILSDNDVNIMNTVIKNGIIFLRVYTFFFFNSKMSIEIEDIDFD